jgi:hypothetical protein
VSNVRNEQVKRDVLAYVSWVWSLQARERERNDPAIDWQSDMSWDEIMACTGWEGRNLISAMTLAPGDLTGSSEINAQLYWPDTPPQR